MTLGVWTRLTQTSLRDSETYVHHPCLSFPCILPVNQEDVSPALTASHHLSLRPPGGKVAGKLDKNRSPCLTSMLLSGRFSPTGSHVVSALAHLSWVDRTSCPHLPGPLYHTHAAPPSSRSCPFPSHREAFKVPSPHGLL